MTNNSALTPQFPPSHQVLSRPYHFCYPDFQNFIPISKILSRLWALAPKVLHLRQGCFPAAVGYIPYSLFGSAGVRVE